MSAAVPKTHISLNVRDVEASVRFYEAFFGVPPHKRRPGYANFDLERPALKLALNEQAPTETGVPGLSHLGVQVRTAEEVDVHRIRLIQAGLATFDEGDTVCCYARQDKVWATDPDGNGWEVYVLLDEMDDHDDHDFTSGGFSAEQPSACCGSADDPLPASGRFPLTMASRPKSDCCG